MRSEVAGGARRRGRGGGLLSSKKSLVKDVVFSSKKGDLSCVFDSEVVHRFPESCELLSGTHLEVSAGGGERKEGRRKVRARRTSTRRSFLSAQRKTRKVLYWSLTRRAEKTEGEGD